MKRLLLFFGALVAGFFLFGLLISGVGWQEVLKPLSALSFFEAFVIFLLTGGFLLLGVLRWGFILKQLGCTFPFSVLWKTYLAGFSLLFFVPMFPFANELFRASWLKEQLKVDLPKGMASVVIDRILEVTSNLLFVMAGGFIFLLLGDRVSYSLRTLGVIGFIGIWLFFVCFLYVRIFQKKSMIQLFWRGKGGIEEIEQEVFRFFQLRNPAFWQGIGVSLGKSFLGVLRVWALIFFFGKGFAALPGITIQGFYYLAVLVPIPAAFGSHEALQAIGFEAFGLGAGTGAAFALVVRALEALFAVAGLLLLFHFGLRLFKNIILRFL